MRADAVRFTLAQSADGRFRFVFHINTFCKTQNEKALLCERRFRPSVRSRISIDFLEFNSPCLSNLHKTRVKPPNDLIWSIFSENLDKMGEL